MDRPYLQIQNAAGRKQIILGAQTLAIGRHKDNQIVLDHDHQVSRFHCVVEKVVGGYLLRDLGSSNGTLVNGRKVRSALLSSGDVVKVGGTDLVLVLPEGEDEGPPDLSLLSDLEAGAAVGRGAAGNGGARQRADAGADDGDAIPLSEADEVEALTDADVVAEDDYDAIPLAVDSDLGVPLAGDPAAAAAAAAAFDPVALGEGTDPEFELALRSLAEAVPASAKTFGEVDIALVNPRGQTVHPAGMPPSAGGRQAVDLFRLLLLTCFRSRATDIHFEPQGEAYRARIRVDGVMVEAGRVKNATGSRIVGVTKILSDIDPSQKNIVQEGHFSARVPGAAGGVAGTHRRVDYRVSFAPAVYGQKLVIRILDPATAPTSMTDLRLAGSLQTELNTAVHQESGMVLVCGPTGSGKTSTLYALLRATALDELNVVTIEDPVEIQMAGITQIPVDAEKGNTFANLLRSVLRQDPDVILVGEIRDAETARIAMQAAITGHLVFSTVHTKDTIGTVFRILDLGVEPYLLSQGLQVVVAQRLVRQLCPFCKAPRPISEDQAKKMGPVAEGVKQTFVRIGCARCLGTGYAGRRAFFELLRVNDRLRDVIAHAPTPGEIQKAMEGTPFEPLQQAGYRLVAEGVVDFEEVERAVGR